MNDIDLTQRVVVITGASSGFGKGVARELSKSGAAVVLAARREQLLEDLARECQNLGGHALPVPTDVSKQADVEELAHAAISVFGRIDVWINNAGVGAIGRFEEIPLADHVQVIETDLVGTLYGCFYALRQFRRQQSGTLINVASAFGKIPTPYYTSYSAAKHGVVGLSGALRQELRENKVENIHVCTVLPMAMDTPFFDHAANYTGHEATPVPPLYDPQQVIDTIVRLTESPEDEVIVAAAGKVAAFAHSIAPGLTENLMGDHTHKSQTSAPPSAATDGGVLEPSPIGTEVSAGRLARR